MALNKYMHPRNKYKSRKPDFKVLSSKYEYFKEKVTVSESGKVILDFKDPAALRVLTQALLEDDFGLTVTIPLDRLIPTVPQRLNYILWLEDMIGQNTPAKGIDIGTGACCVYPLLGCRQNKWKFLASDIDDQNIFFANRNIVNNKMENDIKVKKVSEDTILIGLIEEDENYDFCMCNPPFYSDHLEAQGITTSRSDARSDSSSISTASEAESIAWGGEVRFVTQMIEESVRLKHKVRLFTSLLGKKTSLSLLKDVLSRNKIDKYSTTEFCQGRTMRWGIAWTFDENIKFPKSYFREKKNEKPPLTMTLSRESSLVVGDYTVQAYTWFIWKLLEELKIYFHINHSGKFYSCFSMKCMENTWSHQRRKKRQQKREHCTTKSGETTEQNPDNVVDTSIDLKNESTDSVDSKNVDTAYDATEQNPDNVVEASVDSKNESTDIAGEVDTKNIDTVNDTTCSKVNDGSEIGEKMETGKVESRKRPVEDEKSECVTKKSKIENNESTVGDCSSELKDSKDDNEVNKDKSVNGCSVESSDLESENKVNKEPENKDKSNTLNRKEIVEQFWKELEDNTGKSGPGKKKMESSFYECIEPFKEDEECLLMCKVVLRKEEGVITLTLTHLAGNKEALHQIMQFFKNKFTVQKK